MFHFENIYASIGLIVSRVQNLKTFCIIKVGDKYVWNWLAIFFKNILLPYKLNVFWLKYEKDENTQIHFKTPLIQKFKN